MSDDNLFCTFKNTDVHFSRVSLTVRGRSIKLLFEAAHHIGWEYISAFPDVNEFLNLGLQCKYVSFQYKGMVRTKSEYNGVSSCMCAPFC